MRRSVELLVVLSLVACGETNDPVEAAAAGGGGSDQGSAGRGASGGQVMTQGGKGGADGAGANGGNAGSTGGRLEEQPLLPLVPGRVSSFAFSPIDDSKPMTETCPEPTTSLESGAGLSFDGHEGTLYRTFCTPEPFLIEGAGDDLTASRIKDGVLIPPAFAYIHSPVETGETWASGGGDQYRWEEVVEPLVTPAGTFTTCFHRYATDTRVTYCRGIGLVQAIGSFGNYQLDLVAKNF